MLTSYAFWKNLVISMYIDSYTWPNEKFLKVTSTKINKSK